MLKIELGCGARKAKGFIGVDKNPEHADICIDMEKDLLSHFKENEVDEIRAYNFLEHIERERVIPLINDIWRVLKNNGIFDSYTPSTESGCAAFQDITHKSYWNRRSFDYYTTSFKRFYIPEGLNPDLHFDVISIKNETEKDGNIFVHAILKAIK